MKTEKQLRKRLEELEMLLLLVEKKSRITGIKFLLDEDEEEEDLK